MPTRRFRVPLPLHLRQTLGPLWRGVRDPSMRLAEAQAVRASRTPDGPATLLVRVSGAEVEAEAWGRGAGWALEHAPTLVGADDDLTGFVAEHSRAVARAHHRLPGLRIGASGRVEDVLVPTILGQKVTATEAHRAWFGIVRSWGEPAPGPYGLLTPPSPETLAGQPYWAYHRFGVERRRAETIVRACRRMARLEEAAAMPADTAHRRLTALTGLGPWTAGLVRRIAFGDPDAVEVGDLHVPLHVCWHLAGERVRDDARMLELLEPFRGHRGRVVRLIGAALPHAPARAPRLEVGDIRRYDPPGSGLSPTSGRGRRAPRGR